MPNAEGSSQPGPALPHPIYNWLSVAGGILAVCSLTSIAFFVLAGLLTNDESGYSGLTLLAPLVLAGLGVVWIAIGFARERSRRKRGRSPSGFTTAVLHPFRIVRNTGLFVTIAAVGSITFLLLGVQRGSMALVEFTESNTFCGEVCHQVMNPEATVYRDSAHAEIACVECHVGPGTDSYLRAKIGGLQQLYAVATGSVQRPIPTPIRHQRPSRDMCESCHAANRYSGDKAITRTYFPSAEETIPVRLHMIVKVGGGTRGLMEGKGIHYHMRIARKVEYIARDPKRQDIAWVRVTQANGDVAEYSNEYEPLTDEEKASLEVRVMECIDCHSRPAHRFSSPVESVNEAMATGAISSNIPYIKEASVRALDGGYESTPEALAAIEGRLRSFYEEEHPEVLDDHSRPLEASVHALQSIYESTIFPEMRADWSAHPDNIGHRDSPGCFRCHNDEMVDEEGEAIFADCARCHAILAQDDEAIRTMADFKTGLGFIHPEDSEPFDEFTSCSDCHTGGADLYD